MFVFIICLVDMRYTLNISHLTDDRTDKFKRTFSQILLIFPEVSNKYHYIGWSSGGVIVSSGKEY